MNPASVVFEHQILGILVEENALKELAFDQLKIMDQFTGVFELANHAWFESTGDEELIGAEIGIHGGYIGKRWDFQVLEIIIFQNGVVC